jgi:hypothetical protein
MNKMSKIVHVLYPLAACICLVGLLFSCSSAQKIEIPKPEETQAEKIPFDVPVSTIGFTLALTWAELEKQVNNLMPTKIMDDKDFNKDGLKVHLTKTGPIKFALKINQIQTTIPVNARVWCRYGAFGIYDIKEFRMKGQVNLISYVKLEECAMTTRTKIDKILWDESPTMEFYGRKVPVGYAIDPIIEMNSASISKSIDHELKEMLDFKPQLMEYLQGFREAVNISEDYKLWIQVAPQAFLTTPLRMNSEQIQLDVNLRARIKTSMGKKPEKQEDIKDILFKSDAQLHKEIEINLPVETPFDELNELFTKQLKSTILYEGKKNVTLEEIKLWHSEKKLIIAVRLEGKVKGWLFLRGTPKYNIETTEIYLDDLDYHVNTKNVLVKSLNWMLSGKVLKIIRDNAKYPIKQDLEDLKKEMNIQLNGYKPHESVEIKFRLLSMKFDQLYMTNEGVITLFQIQALMGAKVG